MALTFAQLKNNTRPALLAQIPEGKIKFLTNNRLVEVANQVANDLNTKAEIHHQYFYRTTTAAETNYVLQGPIARIYKIKLTDIDFLKRYWARVPKDADGYGRIVLKTEPDGDELLEVWYLRDILVIDGDDTDEIDLPEAALFDFLDLVKLKILVDLGVVAQAEYDAKFNYATRNINARLDRMGFIPRRPRNFWLGLIGGSTDYPQDEYVYDITKNEKGQENIVADGLGHYYWIT